MSSDLHKKEDLSFTQRWEIWVTPYVPYLIVLCMVILVFLIVALACALMGVSAHSFTGTEANNYYYHLSEVVQ